MPSLHVKLGTVKNFIKKLVTINGEAFEYLKLEVFHKLTKEKIKEDLLNGPDICCDNTPSSPCY